MSKIMIITDHKWRDLPGNTFLKLHLEKIYGHEVLLVRLGEEKLFAPSFKPTILLYNNLYNATTSTYARYLKKQGVKIAILPTEGITFSDNQTLLFSHKFNDIGFIDYYFAWNELIAGAIEKYEVLSPEKIRKVGCCRFDFYTNEMEPYRKNKAYFQQNYGIPEDKPIVLFTTNFANAEFWPNFEFLKQELDRQRASGIETFADPRRMAKYEFDLRNSTFECMKEFCRQMPDVTLIIKYHPSERTSIYHEFVKELRAINPNIYLIEGEYIWDIVGICDVIIQRCSTVAVEAWLMDKQTIELKLTSSDDHFLRPIYQDGSVLAEDAAELVTSVKSFIETDFLLDEGLCKKRKEILSRVIERSEGGATAEIATQLNAILIDENNAKLGKIQYSDYMSVLKFVLHRTFGAKGLSRIANWSKLKFGDYLGRFDKAFTKRDQIEWEEKLKPYFSDN